LTTSAAGAKGELADEGSGLVSSPTENRRVYLFIYVETSCALLDPSSALNFPRGNHLNQIRDSMSIAQRADSPPSPPQILFDEGDVERQLLWHRNRLQSRLDSHQRRIVADLARSHRSDLYKLSAVRVVGGHHTRPEFLSELFRPLLADGRERTLPQILECSDEIHDRLAKLGIFSHLDMSLSANRDDPQGIEALVKVVERGRFFMKTSTDVGNGEGALTGVVRARNICGRADVLEASVGLGNKTRASCQVRAEAPLWAARARGELAANASERDLSGFASCNETVKGLTAKLKVSFRRGSR
jgi:outer membrane protein insertion porin family